ncbi:hypothetical protein P152DRAFT_299251 [Eremomyces bilateralis CBS 781.70]|uniref:Uncharacterized protein n=1 Tax=Eremomyces bilateralis CBS 781.70 TaxID=1392243 RepID=A0A6G1G7H6_9PEZI|nr:uncharacterized protein P152DRAFT_299251 [Eremomyces bilateralis CBS 781.70]KAF1813962.1 hypothetical protein P152DRAFT_299251 [Eremomyces bilateralis CBS 781.70]
MNRRPLYELHIPTLPIPLRARVPYTIDTSDTHHQNRPSHPRLTTPPLPLRTPRLNMPLPPTFKTSSTRAPLPRRIRVARARSPSGPEPARALRGAAGGDGFDAVE